MNGEAKEEVRSKLDIEAVIGEYVQLRRAGRSWKGLSPFSEEKTPSFFVSPERGIWHDFSSNQGGDVFSFVMLVEGLDFRGALELLARKAGVDLSQYEQKSGASRGLGEKKKRLTAMHESATTFYQRSLFAHPEAVDYVKKRGLNKQVVHDFRLGYAPNDGRSLLNFLSKKGYSTSDMRDGGLVGTRGTDLFRDRLMIPLMDGQGQVVGFTARLVRDVQGAPKYLNTPQTLLYDKGRHVFGLHLAKESIRKADRAVIVEGNMDVISSHQAGVANVVATAGTALTDYHLKALSRLTDHVVLSFDGDKAGIAATERGIPMAQAVGVELGIVTLPGDAKDPDELIQKDIGAWQKAIDDSRPAIEWVIAQYERRYDIRTAPGKSQLTTETLKLLGQVSNRVEQEHYLKSLSEKTGTELTTLIDRMNQIREQAASQVRQKQIKTVVPTIATTAEEKQQDTLLAMMLADDGAKEKAQELSVDALVGEDYRQIFRYLVTNKIGEIPDTLQSSKVYVKIVAIAEDKYIGTSSQGYANEAAQLVKNIKREYRKRRRTQISQQISEAEARGDEAEALRLKMEAIALNKEEHNRGKTHS